MTKIDLSGLSDNLFTETPLYQVDNSNEHRRYPLQPYKIVVADDDEEVHRVTNMILRGFSFEGRSLQIIDTYTGAETISVFQSTPDIAILFLDVVMEKDHSGLEVVKTIREELNNSSTRIILRTGQPGEAPEEEVIRDYDINDYRLKTELTANRLKTTLYSALRNYRDIRKIEKHKTGLEKIIKTTSKIFENNTLKDFLTSILEELSNFQQDNPDILYISGHPAELTHGLVTVGENKKEYHRCRYR